ncbi:MAG: hypothetical protein OEQ39_04190 [Gammaproteobacteria bacterium]|nr:hypothetical protein [Gammaproteobacteria bacterium]MDH3466188.1 hypothetical protein [Gammaproteobacteria bacterium]
MITPEILSQLTAKTCRYSIDISDEPIRQDIILSMQGIDPGKTAFMFYVYTGDIQSRHAFFATLFMEVMQDPATQAWIRNRKHQGGYYPSIEALCLIAIMEWGAERAYTQEGRAKLMGVSRGTWCRKYRDIYQYIFSVPSRWEREIIKIVADRLR